MFDKKAYKKAYNKKYYESNREREKARSLKWKKENPDKVKCASKKYFAINGYRCCEKYLKRNLWISREEKAMLRMFGVKRMKDEAETVAKIRLTKLLLKGNIHQERAKELYRLLGSNLLEARKQIYSIKLNGG